MQILLYDKYYDSKHYENNPSKFKNELMFYFKDLDKDVKTFNADIGHGADCPSIIINFFSNFNFKEIITASLISLFFLGEKINKNIDAWLSIFNKVSKLVKILIEI